VDHFGYALVPYLTPYQLDTIQIDPQGLPLGVQLDATSANVAPYAGAIVMVDFKSHYGQALIARIHTADGKVLPFGTEISDARGQTIGTVGQGGLALLRVTSKSGELSARWQGAQSTTQSCAFAYAVPESSKRAEAQPPIAVTCNAGGGIAPAQAEGAP
jgi:outer membrane usher protein